MVELSLSYDNEKFPKIILPNSRHVSSIKQERVQCPLDIATLDIAAALPIATSTPVTNLRQYINSDLGYNELKFSFFFTKIATFISFEVAISNALSFYMLNFTF